jgi:hypothetical protein
MLLNLHALRKYVSRLKLTVQKLMQALTDINIMHSANGGTRLPGQFQTFALVLRRCMLSQNRLQCISLNFLHYECAFLLVDHIERRYWDCRFPAFRHAARLLQQSTFIQLLVQFGQPITLGNTFLDDYIPGHECRLVHLALCSLPQEHKLITALTTVRLKHGAAAAAVVIAAASASERNYGHTHTTTNSSSTLLPILFIRSRPLLGWRVHTVQYTVFMCVGLFHFSHTHNLRVSGGQ